MRCCPISDKAPRWRSRTAACSPAPSRAAGDDLDAALATYETLRKPRAREAVLGSRARARDNHLTSPLARSRRDLRYAWRKRFGGDQTVFQAGRLYDYDAGRELA